MTVCDSGLAGRPGELAVWMDRDRLDMASTVGPSAPSNGLPVMCKFTTGDRYLDAHAIDTVDFLKIDAEGAELDVLSGFADALAGERIGAVQFEFRLSAAMARTWLGDFYELLEPLGFSIGKIFPSYVEWRPYEAKQEVFVRANFLAVHRSRKDMLDELG